MLKIRKFAIKKQDYSDSNNLVFDYYLIQNNLFIKE